MFCIAAHRDNFVQHLSVRLNGSHTFLVVTCHYVLHSATWRYFVQHLSVRLSGSHSFLVASLCFADYTCIPWNAVVLVLLKSLHPVLCHLRLAE